MLPKEDLFAAPHHPKAAAQGVPRRALPSDQVAAQRQRPKPMAGPASKLCAARSSVGAGRAV